MPRKKSTQGSSGTRLTKHVYTCNLVAIKLVNLPNSIELRSCISTSNPISTHNTYWDTTLQFQMHACELCFNFKRSNNCYCCMLQPMWLFQLSIFRLMALTRETAESGFHVQSQY